MEKGLQAVGPVVFRLVRCDDQIAGEIRRHPIAQPDDGHPIGAAGGTNYLDVLLGEFGGSGDDDEPGIEQDVRHFAEPTQVLRAVPAGARLAGRGGLRDLRRPA